MSENRDPILVSVPSFVGMILAIVSLFGSLIFGYATYTERLSALITKSDKQEQAITEVQRDIRNLREALIELKVSINQNTEVLKKR